MKSASVLNIDYSMEHRFNSPNRHEVVLLRHRKSVSNHQPTLISKEETKIPQLYLGKKTSIEELRESNKTKFMNSFMDRRKKERKRQEKRKSQSQIERNLLESFDKTNVMGFELPTLKKVDDRSRERNSKTLELLSKFSSTIINMKSSEIKSIQTEKDETNLVLCLGPAKFGKQNKIKLSSKLQETTHLLNHRKTKSFKETQNEPYIDYIRTSSSILNNNKVIVSEREVAEKVSESGKKEAEESSRVRKKSIKIKGVEPWENTKNEEEIANNEMQSIEFFDFS